MKQSQNSCFDRIAGSRRAICSIFAVIRAGAIIPPKRGPSISIRENARSGDAQLLPHSLFIPAPLFPEAAKFQKTDAMNVHREDRKLHRALEAFRSARADLVQASPLEIVDA